MQPIIGLKESDMKTKRFWIALGCAVWVISVGVSEPATAQQTDLSRIPTRTVTLLSQAKRNDYGKAIFNFALGVRGDAPLVRNRYDLRYGGITDNDDNHWFDVAMGGSSSRVLKDLGELNWSDVYYVPVLFASPVPHSGPVSWSFKQGKVAQISPEGVNVRAVKDHIYMMHVKDEDSDFYVMLRVESLEPEGECTISWKRVPSPEGN